MSRRRNLLNCAFLFCVLSALTSRADELDLFLFCGQSNAFGAKGDGAQYPEDVKKQDRHVPFYYIEHRGGNSGGKWTTLGPQNCRWFEAGNFGPEITFARKLHDAGYKPAVFKYSKSATSLVRNWRAPGKKGMYDSMVAEFAKAMTQLEEQGHKVTVRGFVWIQGESDGKSIEMAESYAGMLKDMIDHLRSTVIKDDTLSFILGVDEQHKSMVKFPQVIEAQQRLAEEDPNIVFTSMKGLPKADPTHLTPEGLVTHGERLFEGFQKTQEEDH